MRYLRTYIKGFRRFILNGTSSLEIDLTKQITVVLGCNGSGKSSLLELLLKPYPAANKSFNKDGCFILEVEVNGHTITLTADFSQKKTYSFILKDDEGEKELNMGGLVTVQRDLVAQYMGLDDDVADILLGKLKFTDMPVSKRKSIISRISQLDLTYAYDLNKRIATKTRDLKGVISHLGNRITTTTKQLQELHIESTEDDLLTIKDDINAITQVFMNEQLESSSEYSRYVQEFESNNKMISGISDKLLKLDKKWKQSRLGLEYDSLDDLTKGISDASNVKQKYVTLTNDTSGRIEELNTVLNNTTDRKTINKLRQEYDTLTKELKALKDSLTYNFFELGMDTLDNISFNQLRIELFDCLDRIPDNSDGRYTKANKLAYEKEYDILVEKISDCKGKLIELNYKIEDAQEKLRQEKINCPKCKHTWHQHDISEDYLNSLIEQRDKITTEGKSLVEASKTLRQKIVAIDDYFGYLSKLLELSKVYPLDSFISQITTDEGIRYSKNQVSEMAFSWTSELGRVLCNLNQVKRRAALSEELKILDSVEDAIYEKNLSDLEKLKKDELAYSKLYNDYNAKVKMLEEGKQLHEQILAGKEKLIKHLELAKKLYTKTNSSLRNKHLNSLLVKLQRLQIEVEDSLKSKQTLTAVSNDLNSQLNSVKSGYEYYKLATEATSSTHGIIARAISGFLVYFTDQMNEILNKIYVYPIHILPCKVESGGDLDYKFPVQIDDSSKGSDDVVETSDGQKDMINLAFRVIAADLLNVPNHPLILDEPTRAQDEVHIGKAIEFIKELIDSRPTRQAFIISHTVYDHGRLNNSNIIVLNSTNITVPAGANENVIVK